MRTRWDAKLLTLSVVAFAVLLLGIAWVRRETSRESPDDLFEDAVAAFNRGDLDRVIEIREILENKPGFQNHALFLHGAILLRNKKYDAALAVLSRVESSGELREPTLLLRGESLFWLGRLAEAERLLRQLVTENPDQVSAHRWLGAIYYDLGAYDLAISELESVIRLAPKDYRPHRLIGLMRLDFEEYQQAINHYRKALALSPPPVARHGISRDLAKAHIAKREYTAALKILSEGSPDAEKLALQSECYWSLGMSQRAQELLKKARSLNATERAVLFLEARMLIGNGQYKQAIAPLQKILQENPQDAPSRYQLALVFRKLGRQMEFKREFDRWKETKKLMEQLTKFNLQAIRRPGDVEIRYKLSKVCQKLGKHELSKMWRQAADACRELGKTGHRKPSLVPQNLSEKG